MAVLPTRSFSTIVQNIAAGIQGRMSSLLDFSDGEPLLAIAQAYASLSLWLQSLFLQAIALTRLATSFGSDVDSWFAQFGSDFSRKGGAYALGALTFSRFTASASTPFIPASTLVNGVWTPVAPGNPVVTIQTTDGTQSVVVIADPTNPAYNLAFGGYYIQAGTTTVIASASAQNSGVGGNIAPGVASVPTTPLVGVDQVSNALAFQGGAAIESDQAVKARFPLFILGLARGDAYGSEYALAALNVAIWYSFTDQYSYANVFTPGYYYFVVDDGSGTPSSAFLNTVTAALLAVKPLGVAFGVFAPTLFTANVSLNIAVAPGFVLGTVEGLVAEVITTNITQLFFGAQANSPGTGAGLDVYMIAAWARSVPGVLPGPLGVQTVLINSVAGDAATIAANPQVRIMPGTISVG